MTARNAEAGGHYCATHDEIFTSNLEVNFHADEGDHVLVWRCFMHGAEAPL